MADVLKRLAYLSAIEGEFEESIKGYQKALSFLEKYIMKKILKFQISNIKLHIQKPT